MGANKFDEPNSDFSIEYVELGETDELFGACSYSGLLPCIRPGDGNFQPEPFSPKPRILYFEFMEQG